MEPKTITFAGRATGWTGRYAVVEPYVAGKCIVDIGASPFYTLYPARERASRCEGVYFANDTHPLKGVHEVYCEYGAIGLHHVNIETDDLPFATDSVDIVTACEVLEHCENFPARFASEARRILRPGGLIFITVPNIHSIANIARLVLQKNIYMRYRNDATGRHRA